MNEPKEPNSREYRAIERLAVLSHTLRYNIDCMEERLKSVPDLYRQWRVAQTAISKVVDGVYETLPGNTLKRMQRVAETCDFVIRPSGMPNRASDATVMLDNDILTLVNSAMAARCAICMKEGKEVKRCDLRKVLMNVVTLDEPDKGSLCGYARIAAGIDIWEDE